MTTRFVAPAIAVEEMSGVYLSKVNGRPVVVFPNSGTRQAIWTSKAAQGLTGTITAVVDYFASVTSGAFTFAVEVEAIAEGDTVDLDSATSFDSANSAADTVPAVAGYLAQHVITLAAADGMAAGDLVRVRLARTDSTTGTAYVLAVEIRDAA